MLASYRSIMVAAALMAGVLLLTLILSLSIWYAAQPVLDDVCEGLPPIYGTDC